MQTWVSLLSSVSRSKQTERQTQSLGENSRGPFSKKFNVILLLEVSGAICKMLA